MRIERMWWNSADQKFKNIIFISVIIRPNPLDPPSNFRSRRTLPRRKILTKQAVR